MSGIEIKLPKNNDESLMVVGRSFIGLIVVIFVDFIWESMRDNCNVLSNKNLFSWIQLLISWIILSVILAIQLPKNILHVIIYASFIGILIGFVGTPCNNKEKDIGSYIADILQSLSMTMAASASIYGVSKMLKWYPK